MIIFNLLLTIYFWGIASFSTILVSIICIIVYPFVDQKTFARIFEKFSGTIILYSMLIPGFWSVTVKDYRRDTSWDGKRYVIVANHLSFIDSLITLLIPLKKKFMMGRVFSKVPLFGWITKAAGFVLVDNKDTTTLYDAVDRAVDTMKDGCSFMIYPEGKRTKGNLEKFKTGAYRIAQKTQLQILPLCLKNTNIGMPIGGLVKPADIEIIIGEPFYIGTKWDSVIKGIYKTKQFILSHQ